MTDQDVGTIVDVDETGDGSDETGDAPTDPEELLRLQKEVETTESAFKAFQKTHTVLQRKYYQLKSKLDSNKSRQVELKKEIDLLTKELKFFVENEAVLEKEVTAEEPEILESQTKFEKLKFAAQTARYNLDKVQPPTTRTCSFSKHTN